MGQMRTQAQAKQIFCKIRRAELVAEAYLKIAATQAWFR